MITARTTQHLALALSLAAVVACGGNSDSAPEVTAPPPATRAPTTTIEESGITTTTQSTSAPTSTSTVVDDTAAPSTEPAVTTSAPGEGFLPDDLGRRIDSVPGVNSPGEIVELTENVVVFVPSEPDPDDPNVLPPLPEDREILIAYSEATAAVYEQVTQEPVPIEPSERMQAAYADGGEIYRPVFEQLNSDGQHLDFQFGTDVSRPVVIADPRSDTEVFVFDCSLVASVYVNADGTLVDGETPGVETQPLITRVVLQEDGTWIVDEVQEDDRACS